MEEKSIPSWKVLNGTMLKIIALVTMMIDHIGAGIIEPGIIMLAEKTSWDHVLSLPNYAFWFRVDTVLRLIGRVSFPIFCFLLVEGFLHTRSVKKYALRLLAFAFISEIPYDLAFRSAWFDFSNQNVFFTLFLGLAALIGIKKFEESFWKQAVVIVACCGSAMLLSTDYGAFGVFFVVLLYLLRYNPRMQTILGSAALLWEPTAALSFIPIRMYNGTRGTWNLKYIFYAAYPVHILLFAGIRMLIFS